MSDESMVGKVVLITGGTDGIGKQAAKELAKMGATVVVVGRSEARCQASVEEIRTFSATDRVDYLLADLSSMAQVKGVAETFRQKYNRLDVLVNNAGAGFVRRQLTPDGYEMTFALNHMAYYLLTRLLLDMLKTSTPSRVVNTSSNSHFRGRIFFEDLMLKRGYSVMKGYSQSKLANVLFTFELSRQLNGLGVTANCLHPGLVDTGIFRKRPLGWLISPFITSRAISVEEGAETIVYLASSPEVSQISGEYFYKKKVGKTAELARVEADQKRLWEISEELVGKWL